MKVLFISHSSGRGGSELSLLELVDALRERSIGCACVLPTEGPLRTLLETRNVETVIVPFRPWARSWGSGKRSLSALSSLRQVPGILRLAAAIQRLDCDVVYTNTIAVGAAAVAARLVGAPHVWHIREFGYDDHDLRFDLGVRVSRRLIGLLSSACIANSRAVADDYRPHLGKVDLAVVYNAVELPARDPGRPQVPCSYWEVEGSIRCLLLATVLPGKGQEEAVEAMSILRRQGVPAELLIMGPTPDGDFVNHLVRRIEEFGLRGRVHFSGHSDNPLPAIESADIALVCSRREAFGRAAVEAMKIGKPVIGSRAGGTPEVVQDRETGFLYEQGNPFELAARIADLHADPGLRQAMGRRARISAHTRFNRERYGRGVAQILERVIQDRSNALGVSGVKANVPH